jgi:hypothetical protein
MSGPAAFWIAVAVFSICEAVLTLRGIDTLLWKFKTPNELEYQRKLMGPPSVIASGVAPAVAPSNIDALADAAFRAHASRLYRDMDEHERWKAVVRAVLDGVPSSEEFSYVQCGEVFVGPTGEVANITGTIGYLRVRDEDAANGCRIEPIYRRVPHGVQGGSNG